MTPGSTGADLAVAALEKAGVEVAFGLPGVHNLALWRALGESGIRLVGVRHEQTAAYAADGYARASGRIGVAITTTGPGAANTLGAVGEAWASRSPILVIATDIPTTARRPGVWRGVLHEATDQAAMFMPVVKEAYRVTSAGHVGSTVAAALRTALAAPSRPVYVEIPTDLLAAEADAPSRQARGAGSPGAAGARSAPREEPLVRALELLERSRSPLIWAGGGALQAGAGEAVGRLAERLVAPVILTYSARGILPPGHPCLVEGPPHIPAVGALWDDADLVVGIGTDFDAMMTQGWRQPQPPHLVAVNVDPADASKNYRPDVLLEADAARAADRLAERLSPRGGHDALATRIRSLNLEIRAELARAEPEASDFLDAVEAALPDDAVVVSDMCIPGYWLGGFHRVKAPRKFAYPLGWGTLGCAFPQGLGAALAGAGPVVSVSGDGGFLYAAGELAAAEQEDIPLTAVIVDDGGYGMIRFDQDLHGHPREGVDLHSPDFVALAAAFGVRADIVEGLGEHFAVALRGHVAMREPTVLVARAALDPPPNVSPRWYRT
ncbi:MAG TPA: thiamine pyrophosphate-binding protein [Thermoleophilaceae bacterium]|jgi:acetolactate synthase-1/2/3 large subunit|nr:thiamine pyrophosphate-binding protein [Thermoleophilaceae bacterium]